MKNLLIAVIAMCCTSLFSQNTIVWKGGTPGNENAWTEKRNWMPNQLPNAFSDVIIKFENNGHNSQPIINSKVEVASLRLGLHTQLIIRNQGELVIDGRDYISYGIMDYGGEIVSFGNIELFKIELTDKFYSPSKIGGNGQIFIDGVSCTNSFAVIKE